MRRRDADTPGAGPAEIERLIALLAKLPGLGPRSARRATLHLLRRAETVAAPLAQALAEVALRARPCTRCRTIDTAEICAVCADPSRADGVVCVVEEIGDLWALERAGVFRGRYHVLGGLLSALDGVGPEALGLPELVARARDERLEEVVLALGATVDGQTTAHVIAETLAAAGLGLRVTTLARGVPLGGELGWLDDGTLAAAFGARRVL